jgi:tRNA threonylcarbamoyladenosine biosynthesis protein TsaB
MRILAIETVDKTGTLAATEGGRLLTEVRLDPARRSAQTLAPTIQQLLVELGWQPGSVDLVAVATGPGSFTGLRIGVTTAKTFAYAAGCQVLGIHTMLAIGARAPADVERFSAVIDAQRGELFVADLVRAGDGQLTGETTTRIELADTWLENLPIGSRVTGPGLAKWIGKLPPAAIAFDSSLWQPTAAAVAKLAHDAHTAGRREELLALSPQYFRRTAAEEQWERRSGEK